MAVKASVSISEQQELFARRLVEEGHYASVSDVVQHGLELVRAETELDDADIEALRELLAERTKGPFLNAEQSRKNIDAMLAAKRAKYGL